MNPKSFGLTQPTRRRRLSLPLVISALFASLLVLIAPGSPAAAQSSPAAGVYMPLSPSRILDTRNAGSGGIIPAQTSRDIQVTGLGGVPTTDVVAVVLDLSAVNNTSDGWGLLWQQGTTRPSPASSINYVPGRAVTNAVTVKVSATGKVSYFTWVATDLILDVVGYYRSSPGGGGYLPVTQTRILDTRDSGVKMAAGSTMNRKLRGVAGVPDSPNVTAVAVNVSAFDQDGPGFLTFWPRGTTRPGTSSLNFGTQRMQTELVVATLSADGWTSIYNYTSANIHLLLDVVGYYTAGAGASFVPLTPTRIIDTRYHVPGWGIGPITQPLGPDTNTAIQLTGVAGVPTTGVSTVLVNAVAGDTPSVGWLNFWASGAVQPGTLSHTYYPNETTANLVMAQVGTDGKAIVSNYYGSSALIVDIVGYFTEPDASTTMANGVSNSPSTSATGRFVAFESAASNMVRGDTNGTTDVFVRDRGVATTARVSVSSSGAQANGASSDPAISGGGNHVAFASAASNLISNDTNGKTDIYLHNRVTKSTTRVSVTSTGGQSAGAADSPAISEDGRFVAFRSDGSDLVAADSNGVSDIFVRDTVDGTTSRVSVSSTGQEATAASLPGVSISADGRYVAFTSCANNLVAGDANGACDVFLRDRTAGTTLRVSISGSGAEANGLSDSPSVSGDGRYVAFRSDASNLVGGDGNGVSDVFVRDRAEATTLRLSLTSGGAEGNGPSDSPSMSSDGRYVLFRSDASDLIGGDTNGAGDIFERDVPQGRTARFSFDDARGQGNGASYAPAISADGSTAVFASIAPNLPLVDLNGLADILVHVLDSTREKCHIGRVSVPYLGTTPEEVDTQPRQGQVIYRVWGGGSGEFVASWTPVDPRILGPDRYREAAGLPDRINTGTRLTIATLNTTAGVVAKLASPLGPQDGPAPGAAYRSYEGGLVEYVFTQADAAFKVTKTAELFLNPIYGGIPVGCTASQAPDRGCVGEYHGS